MANKCNMGSQVGSCSRKGHPNLVLLSVLCKMLTLGSLGKEYVGTLYYFFNIFNVQNYLKIKFFFSKQKTEVIMTWGFPTALRMQIKILNMESSLSKLHHKQPQSIFQPSWTLSKLQSLLQFMEFVTLFPKEHLLTPITLMSAKFHKTRGHISFWSSLFALHIAQLPACSKHSVNAY